MKKSLRLEDTLKYSRVNTTDQKDECVGFHAKTRQKQLILEEMKKQGLRITSQRSLVIDIIISNECTCCKEIYYQANHIDPSIGIATVYRMLKTLEEIGIIDRKNLYKITCDKPCEPLLGIELEMEDHKRISLSSDEIKSALSLWMKTKGNGHQTEISNIYQCAVS